MHTTNTAQRGFTLIEMSIVLVIIGLIVVGTNPCFAKDSLLLWCPNHALRLKAYFHAPHAGRGEEIEEVVVFDSENKEVATAHVWLTEPDGTLRVRIRGCEKLGWLDNARFFCEGTASPHIATSGLSQSKH